MGDLWVATPSSNRFSRDLCVKKATTKFHPTNFLLEDAAKIKKIGSFLVLLKAAITI